MPGKHAPKSPVTFYVSLARAGAGVVGALGLVTVLALVAFGGRGNTKLPSAGSTPSAGAKHTPTASATPSPTSTPTVPTVGTPTASVRPNGVVTVSVLNGSQKSGLATKTANQVKAAGWKVARVGNYAPGAKKSVIYYQPGYEQEALALQAKFTSVTDIKPAISGIAGDVDLTMILGADYP